MPSDPGGPRARADMSNTPVSFQGLLSRLLYAISVLLSCLDHASLAQELL